MIVDEVGFLEVAVSGSSTRGSISDGAFMSLLWIGRHLRKLGITHVKDGAVV